jgi:transposase
MSDSAFWLTEEQFARLAPLLPKNTRGVPRVDDRRVISGIIHVLRSGCRWKDAPPCYGSCKTLYNRFVRWAAKGTWEAVFTRLAEAGGPPAALMIDATHVKAHRSAAGGKGGPRPRASAAPAVGAPPRSTPPSTSRDDPGA